MGLLVIIRLHCLGLQGDVFLECRLVICEVDICGKTHPTNFSST